MFGITFRGGFFYSKTNHPDNTAFVLLFYARNVIERSLFVNSNKISNALHLESSNT